MNNERTFTTLAFAGVTPFVAAALLSVIGIGSIPVFGTVNDIVASYGLAIICFLAGTHWAFQLLQASDAPFNLFISSNVAVVFVWCAYLALHTGWILAIQAITLAALLFVDYRLRRDSVVSSAYFRARSIATSAAILSLVVILVFE